MTESTHLIFYGHIWQREESKERAQESRGRGERMHAALAKNNVQVINQPTSFSGICNVVKM